MTYELATPTTAQAGRRVQLPPAAELWRTTVTAVLLALLVAWMFATWWSAPREAAVAQLDRAVATGEVTSFVRTTGMERSGTFWANELQPREYADGELIVWQTTSGRTFYVDTVALTGAELSRSGPLTEPPSPKAANREAAAIAKRLETAGVPELYRSGSAPMIAMILVLVGLVVLVSNPPPTRGTRWFWFWSAGAPAALGVLAYVIFERLRPASRPVPVAGAKDLRWHGFAGLGVYFLATVVCAMFLPWLLGVFGSLPIPG